MSAGLPDPVDFALWLGQVAATGVLGFVGALLGVTGCVVLVCLAIEAALLLLASPLLAYGFVASWWEKRTRQVKPGGMG